MSTTTALLEQRQSANHTEGRALVASLKVDDHDVVHHEKAPQEVGHFRRVAAKEQQRMNNVKKNEADMIGVGLDQEPTVKVSTDKPLWKLKIEVTRAVAQRRTERKFDAAEMRAEFNGRKGDIEGTLDRAEADLKLSLQADFEKCLAPGLAAVGAAEAKVVEIEAALDLITVAGKTASDCLALLAGLKADDGYKAVQKEAKAAIAGLRKFGGSVAKDVDSLDTCGANRENRGSRKKGKQPELSVLLVSFTEASDPPDSHNVKKEIECFLQEPSQATLLDGSGFESLRASVKDHAHTTSQLKHCDKQLAKSRSKFCVMGVCQAKAQREFKRAVNGLDVGSHLLRQVYADAKSDMMRIYEFQYFKHLDGQHSAQLNPYCIPEARILLEGEELLIGLKVSDVVGTNLKDKIASIYSSSLDELLSTARTHGFVLNLSAASGMALILAGYIVVNFTGSLGCVGFRWGLISSKEQLPRIVELQEMLTSACPETNSLIMQGASEAFKNEDL